MNSKTSYTLCTPPAHKSCEKLPNSIFDSDIAKRLYLAQQKLRPVIDDVMRTATENSAVIYDTRKSHYLTVEQYEDAILASQILRDVDKIISKKQNGMNMKKYNFKKYNLEKESVKVNKSGKIYVDTSILIQLIELHTALGDIINNTTRAYVDEGNDLNELSSYSQTKNSNTSVRYDSYKAKELSSDEKFNVTVMHNSENSKPKIRINVLNSNKSDTTKYNNAESKLTGNIIREVLPLGSYPLGKSIVVMSAHTTKSEGTAEQKLSSTKKLSILPEERTSNSETNLSDVEHSPRKVKSTGSIKSDSHKSKVTNVDGARKIILNCLYDLKKVRSFLGRIDIGADVQINTAVLDANNYTDDNNMYQSSDTEQSYSEVELNKVPESHHQHEEKPRSNSGVSGKHTRNVKDNFHIESHKKTSFNLPESSKRDCCCDATYASDVPMELLLDAGDENASKLIICIKGKTEDEGDVQIIIRQCSECKNIGGKELIDDQITDKSGVTGDKQPDEDRNEFTSDSATHVEKSHTLQDEDIKEHTTSAEHSGIRILYDSTDLSDINVRISKNEILAKKEQISGDGENHNGISTRSSEGMEHSKVGINVLFDPDDPSKSIVEPTITIHSEENLELKNNGHDGGLQERKSGLNIIFDPQDPSKSVVEPTKEALVKTLETGIPPEKVITQPSNQRIHKKTEDQSDGYSRIKLFETTNLCLSTEDGQELVISLTVRPKSGGNALKLSLKDIFSESNSKSEDNQTQDHIEHIFGSDNKITVGIQDKQHYERFIPLSRTKICSSLEFDVSVMETRLRNKGIKHINPGIVVRLKELGVNNLLRACRPVKCGRTSVLNEKLRKGTPYSASLTSLPLEETDADIIDQSLEMSFNKIKHSSVKSKKTTLAYCTEIGNINNNISLTTKNMQIGFLHVPRFNKFTFKNQSSLANSYVKKKLSYYINLIHDVQTSYKDVTYEVYFFEIKKYGSHISQKSDTCQLLSDEKKYAVDNVLDKGFLIPLKKEKGTKLISPKYTLKENIIQSLPLYDIECVISNSSLPLKNEMKTKNLGLKCQNCKEKNKFISKIPVYKYNKIRRKTNNDKRDSNSYIYDISLQSLPRKDSKETKDIPNNDLNCHNGHGINDKKLESNFLNHNETCNKSYANQIDQNKIEKISCNGKKSGFNQISDDSLELYFNNFFRDKYFSKLALCQQQSSNRSLKPRNKKSGYHCSRSQSQTYFSNSRTNMNISGNISNQTQISEQINNSKKGTYCKSNYKKFEENIKISQSAIFQFTRLCCEHWIKYMLLNEQEEVVNKKITQFSSSHEILNNETIQNFFANIQPKILKGNTSKFLSQPNVEAGMDNEEDFIQFNCLPRPSSENILCTPLKDTLISFKGIEDASYHQPMFKNDKANKIIGIHSRMENNSCDNFQNVIVTFENNTCVNEFPKSTTVLSQKGSYRHLGYSVANNGSFETSENVKNNTERSADANKWNQTDRDTLHYLVYQNYFSSLSLLQRVFEKSKGLFKSNCRTNKQSVTVEHSSLCLKEKNLDTIDYCFCPKSPPATSFKNLSRKKTNFLKMKLSESCVQKKRLFRDAECKMCGCSIMNCQSKTTNGPCACANTPKLSKTANKKGSMSKTLLNRVCSKELKCKKEVPKKSVGMICFPRKADISICVKLSDQIQQEPMRKCYCVKCEKRSDDGSCYCSHCLGVFDKSIGITPSNKEIATQCICYKSDNVNTTRNEFNTINKPSNTSENKAEEAKHVLYLEVKPEPDINQSKLTISENNNSQPLSNIKTEDNKYDPFSSDQNEIPKFITVKKDIYPDENYEENLSFEENKEPLISLKNEFQDEEPTSTFHEEYIKKESD